MKTVNTNRLNQLWKEGVLPKIKALLDDLTESINGVDEKIDVLDTKEEIEANTDEEKMAGALAVKGMFGEINSKLSSYIKFVSGSANITIQPGWPYDINLYDYITRPNGYAPLCLSRLDIFAMTDITWVPLSMDANPRIRLLNKGGSVYNDAVHFTVCFYKV